MRKFALSVVTACLLASSQVAFAQSDSSKRSDELFTKMRQVDMLSQILPAVFTTDQLKKILPVLEKCRKVVRDTEAKEVTVMTALEAMVDRSIKAGIDKKQMPKGDVKAKISTTVRLLTSIRESVTQDNVSKLYEVLKAELNAGQLRAIANAFSPKSIDPKLDSKNWTQEKKVKFWIRVVLLDPASYPLLVKLSR